MGQTESRRWLVLAVGLLGLIAGCAAQYGLAVLIPALRSAGYTLGEASLLVTAPIPGILCTLILWGAAADRWGERRILTIGLAGAGVAQIGASRAEDPILLWVLLFLAGASSASIHSASGRLILGWFGTGERGLAMGIRQMGQPLGVGFAALVLPSLALNGVDDAFLALGIACLGSALLIGIVVRDPERPPSVTTETAHSPYREAYLWRIHVASALLVVPQFAVAVFAFDYLVSGLGWSIGAAGILLAAAQLAGATSRLLAGWWSDRVGSRLRPMRLVAIVIGVAMVALALLGAAGAALAVAALAVAAVLTTTPNGLAFTAVAERAGSSWAGRALGVQNTFQNGIATLVPVPLALIIAAGGGEPIGYALAFGAVAWLPFVAAAFIPLRAERSSRPTAPERAAP